MMSDLIKEELQARLGHNYQKYANILENWCRGNLSWEDLEMNVARIVDPVSLELHNRYISSMVSRLESDPTVSDPEPPKKRQREMQQLDDLMSSIQNVNVDADSGLLSQALTAGLDSLEGFPPVDDEQMESIAADALTLMETETPWYGPPPEEEDGPSLCLRLGRLPDQQELIQRLLSIASNFKVTQISQEAMDLFHEGLQIYVESIVQHLLTAKRPFRCSQHFRVKPPFCNEPYPLHDRFHVDPLLLQQPKLFARRPSAELHSNGACDVLCQNASVRSLEFYPKTSRSLRNPDSPFQFTLQDVYKLISQPEPTVVNRASFQMPYVLIPDSRNRETIHCLLLNSLSNSSEHVENSHTPRIEEVSATIEEMDASDEENSDIKMC